MFIASGNSSDGVNGRGGIRAIGKKGFKGKKPQVAFPCFALLMRSRLEWPYRLRRDLHRIATTRRDALKRPPVAAKPFLATSRLILEQSSRPAEAGD
jgi:hypothetical protein